MSNDIFAVLKADNDQNSFLPKITDIYSDLNIQPDQNIAQTSISHVFRCVCQNAPRNTPYAEENAKNIREEVVDKVEFRYSLLDTYAEDFFKNEKDYDRDALTMAVICDDLLDKPFRVSHASDQDNLVKAYQLWLEAADIESDGLDDNDTPDRTAWFLASINILEQLNNFRNNIDDYPTDELVKAKDTFFPIAGSIIDPQSLIGAEIHKQMDDLDDLVTKRRPLAPVIHIQAQPQLDA